MNEITKFKILYEKKIKFIILNEIRMKIRNFDKSMGKKFVILDGQKMKFWTRYFFCP